MEKDSVPTSRALDKAGETYTVSEHDLLQNSLVGTQSNIDKALGISQTGLKEIISSNKPTPKIGTRKISNN